MNQEKLESFMVEETLVSNIPEIIKAIKKAYEGMLMEIGRDDCNIVYAGGCLREAKWLGNQGEGAKYSDLNESVAYCGEISSRIYDFVKKEFGDRAGVTIEGHFMGEGAKYSTDQHGDHMWVVLADGTIVDGAYKQYQDPSMKKRKRIRFVKPTDPEYADYGFSCTSINSNYGEDYNPVGRVKIPIDNAKVSYKIWSAQVQEGTKVRHYSHVKDYDEVGNTYGSEHYIDPIREHKRCADIRDRLQREELFLKQIKWIDGIKTVYPKRVWAEK